MIFGSIINKNIKNDVGSNTDILCLAKGLFSLYDAKFTIMAIIFIIPEIKRVDITALAITISGEDIVKTVKAASMAIDDARDIMAVTLNRKIKFKHR